MQKNHQLLAESLKNDYRKPTRIKEGYCLLQPLAELAERYSTSPKTVQRALEHLQNEGYVVRTSLKRAYLLREPGCIAPSSLRPKNKAHHRFAGMLRDKILSGQYRSGMQLPKVAYFVESCGISTHTVIKAIKQLAAEGLLHKDGIKWIIGKPLHRIDSHSIESSYYRDNPVVTVIAENPNKFTLACEGNFFSDFTSTFLNELAMHSAETVVCYQDPSLEEFGFVAGFDRIIEHIRSLDSRHIGTLCLFSEGKYPPGFYEALLRGGSPVLDFSTRPIKKPELNTITSHQRFYQCVFDEEDAVRKALTMLHTSGHRRIGMLNPYSGEDASPKWPARRIKLTQKFAADYDPALQCFVADQKEELFRDSLYSDLFRPFGFTNPGKNMLTPQVTVGRAIENSPSLDFLLNTCHVTALFAMNDYFARDYFFWLTLTGIRIPEDISIVSIDNASSAEAVGLTSIDPGLDYAGHQAAHLLLGTIAPPTARPAWIKSRPWLVRRKSVAACPGSQVPWNA
jgi:DNA-binding LacI/PurR family transcriptional regulator/DNA-binding transcriptional regulator YhcF (GntR family)